MTELDFVLDRSGSMAGPVSAGYGPAGFYVYASNFPYKKKNPNASPTWKIQFGYPYLRKSNQTEQNRGKSKQKYTYYLSTSARSNFFECKFLGISIKIL